jgi:hypothetical protein
VLATFTTSAEPAVVVGLGLNPPVMPAGGFASENVPSPVKLIRAMATPVLPLAPATTVSADGFA